MAIDVLKSHIPGIKEHGIVTDATVSLSGTTTLSGATSISGAATFTSTTAGIRRSVVSGSDATYTLTTAQSGTVFVATKGSATQTYTLPAVATAGVIYTFICGDAAGEILVTPQESEAIKIVTFAAIGADADTAVVAPAAGTGIKNTAATNAVTDNLTLVSDGTRWFSVGLASGIWASQ